MTDSEVRVRFAPSPTGFLHLGNARTAVFNWLYARHTGGKLILRVEDTDRQRSTQEAESVIFEALKWLGLEWDEGPFRQSERNEIYKSHVQKLLDEGRAYHCWCTPEELEERRRAALKEKRTVIYDGRCRERSKPREGVDPVVRFKAEKEGVTVLNDLNQGEIVVNNSEIDDLIIMRADGTFTYNLTVVVDDHDMGITHVIRGADHVTNTPRQIQMYRAFGFDVPEFAHHGLVMGPDRSKLSKRHGAVSVTQYRDQGFLPEALMNALARLGWSHGDQEIFSVEELVNLFDIKDVSPSHSIFDFDKLTNLFGQEHIMRASRDRLIDLVLPELEKLGINVDAGDENISLAVEAGRKRASTMVEMASVLAPMFRETVEFDEKAVKKNFKPKFIENIEALILKLEALEDWSPEPLMDAFRKTAEEKGVGLGKVAQPARVAMTGSSASPGIDVVAAVIGRQRTLDRLRSALEMMKQKA